MVADCVRKKCLFFFVFVLFLVAIMKQFCVMKKGLKDCLWFFSKTWCYLYILVLRIVSRNFFLFLFFFLTYILLLQSLNNFVSLKGIKGFFYRSSLLGVVRNIERFGILLIRGSESFYWDCVFCRCFITAESMNFFEQISCAIDHQLNGGRGSAKFFLYVEFAVNKCI